MFNILQWSINDELKKETEEHYRTQFALDLKNEEPLTIIRQITFDKVAPNIEIKDLENLIDFVENNFLKNKIKGIGLEVGAGPATFSSVLAKRKPIEKMYAVEVCEPIVKLLAPKIADYVLNGKSEKVIGVIGSFDNMELPDESVDFVFDFFSLHHSNNLAVTLKECFRILKKDGFIFCFDKARPDYFTEKDLNELLDTEYSENDKKLYDFSLDKRFTRRMNGEKEYRLKDWNDFFNKAGFTKIENYYLAKLNKRFIKRFLSVMPVWVQTKINKLLPESKFSHKFILSQENKVYSGLINYFPKEISLLIAYKSKQ
ncbi:MAG: class I SAM-dependent methyltransferase [Patescibacteria group bacterium]